MKKLLQTLTETSGPSGYEDEVREIVRKEVSSLADEIRVDALGNLIVCKQPGKAAKPGRKIMIAAQLDEVGVMVSHVDRQGFVRFSPVGNLPRRYLPGSRVRFLNGTQGVIAASPAGRLDGVDELPTLDQFYIDIGVTGSRDCPVKIGEVAVFEGPYQELGDRLVAKAMGSRAGILVAIETLRNLKSVPYELSFVFTTRQEAGMPGALTSAHGVDPDIGIALDGVPADDMPQSGGARIALGKGPCVIVQDAGMIADTRLVTSMTSTEHKNKIPYQRAVLASESSAASAIQLARAGVLSGRLSVPVRYLHSSSEMVDISDVQNAVRLLSAILYSRIEV